MAIWGRVFGSIAGTFAAGPVGGIAGFILGEQADKRGFSDALKRGIGVRTRAFGAPDAGNAVIFTSLRASRALGKKDAVLSLGTLALAAKMARIDGPVNHAEIRYVKSIFAIPSDQTAAVGKLFDKARDNLSDYPAIAREIRLTFPDDKTELEKVLTILFGVARADLEHPLNSLRPQETEFLETIARIFELSERSWEKARTGGGAAASDDLERAYVILGVSRSSTNDAVRARWKTLMRTYHPDLANRRLNEAEKTAWLEKAQAINGAWDAIRRARDL